MARRARSLTAGGIQHVINRGALRAALFADAVGCQLFVGALRDALAGEAVDLLAWCVMPNHWHLLVRPRSAEALPTFMRRLTLTHSRRWQAFHDRPGQGTLYQGRYRSAPVVRESQGHRPQSTLPPWLDCRLSAGAGQTPAATPSSTEPATTIAAVGREYRR
jgi:REP element-mobilizing transposase RayT